MIKKWAVNRFGFLLISFLTSILTCFFLGAAIVELFSDNQFVASLHLPPEADSLSIPIAFGLMKAMAWAVIIILIHIILLILCFTRLNQLKIDMGKFLFHKKEPILNLMRLLSYGFGLYILINYLIFQKSMDNFFEFQLFFSLLVNVTIVICIIWIANIFIKKEQA